MAQVTVKVTVDIKLPAPATGKRLAELWLANEVLKDTRPFVPMLTGSLNQRSHVEAGKTVVYPGPYARYLYEGKRMVNAKTGRGPRWISGVGWRWPKGAKLRPTGTPLRYGGSPQPDGQGKFVWVGGNSPHKDATDHWLEPSKAKNVNKWLKGVTKILSGGRGDAE